MHRWWSISFPRKGLSGEIFGVVLGGAGLSCMLQNIHYPLASPPGFDQWHPSITATSKPLTDFPNTPRRQSCPCWKPLHCLCEKKSMCREEISYSWMLLVSSFSSFFLLNSLTLWKCSLQDEPSIRESAWESLEIKTIFFSKQLEVCLLRLSQPKGQLYHDPWRESECLLTSTSAEWTGGSFCHFPSSQPRLYFSFVHPTISPMLLVSVWPLAWQWERETQPRPTALGV